MKSMEFRLLLILFSTATSSTVGFVGQVEAQDNAGPIDFGTWTVESHPAACVSDPAVWTASSDGLSVCQSQNGQPTFLYSDFLAFNTRFQGKIVVDAGDDDYIGFALGFQPGDTVNPNAEYLLIDWKKDDQLAKFLAPSDTPASMARRGLAVSRVFGTPTADELWGHVNFGHPSSDLNNGVEELARGLNLGDTGWIRGRGYVFRCEFSANSLNVFVDGNLEINITGTFK